jgi:hypothetical protein
LILFEDMPENVHAFCDFPSNQWGFLGEKIDPLMKLVVIVTLKRHLFRQNRVISGTMRQNRLGDDMKKIKRKTKHKSCKFTILGRRNLEAIAVTFALFPDLGDIIDCATYDLSRARGFRWLVPEKRLPVHLPCDMALRYRASMRSSGTPKILVFVVVVEPSS